MRAGPVLALLAGVALVAGGPAEGQGAGARPLPVGSLAPRGSGASPSGTGNAAPRGRLARAAVHQAIAQHRDEVNWCHTEALRRNEHFAGAVTVRFVVDAAGAVTSVVVTGNTTNDEEAATCVRQTLRRIAFPSPRGGAAELTHTFNFNPPE